MVVRKVSDRLTHVTPLQFLQGLSQAWVNIFTTPAKKEQLLVLAAQSAIETGRWKYNHSYNFGNVKSVEGDGRDYCYFACWEVFSKPVAAAYVANSRPDARAAITEHRSDGTDVVWFYPEHPACRFRAYEVHDADGKIDEWASMVLGLTDYLGLLHKRFYKAWPAVLKGDPAEFVRELKKQGYFTADLQPYIDSEVSLFREFSHLQLDYSALPVVPDDKKAVFGEATALAVQEYLADLRELEQT